MMKNNINIIGNDQLFTYIIEYNSNKNYYTDSSDIKWSKCTKTKKCIHLFEGDVKYFRHENNWYESDILKLNNQYIPEDSINTGKIKIYIPNHNVSTYEGGIKYAVTANTWINGYKIDLGSFIFKPTDTIASNIGTLKYGNNEYLEYIEFDIIDPFYLVYSDKWIDFRKNVCKEPLNINSTGSLLCISLYVINNQDNNYLINSEYTGGITSFNISKNTDYLELDLKKSLNPLGLKIDLTMNSEYNWLLDYIKETYGLYIGHNNIKFDVVIKNKDSIITSGNDDPEKKIKYAAKEGPNYINGVATQYITWENLINNNNYNFINTFFNSWENYEDGWNFVTALLIYNDNKEEIFSVVSNELPITQELFSIFINGGAEKIIDIEMINRIDYNIVNKIENKIFQLERPNDSKSNMIHPVFFRVKETEILTLHPNVTENICINLDDYKSKVDNFVLQIDNCNFYQIGSNNYGILFKVIGNKISKDITSGTYYILDENMELITTGKYNCVR